MWLPWYAFLTSSIKDLLLQASRAPHPLYCLSLHGLPLWQRTASLRNKTSPASSEWCVLDPGETLWRATPARALCCQWIQQRLRVSFLSFFHSCGSQGHCLINILHANLNSESAFLQNFFFFFFSYNPSPWVPCSPKCLPRAFSGSFWTFPWSHK